jgi:hypothetical protein
LAFLLASRSRANNLVKYGAHLSPMLVDLAKSLASPSATEPTKAEVDALSKWLLIVDEIDESPYLD